MKPSGLKWAIVIALAITAIDTTPAQAERRGGFLSNLFGGGQQNRTRTRTRQSSAQRQANQALQTALNFFELDAGTVDGILGQRSREAIKRFQTLMADEPTGRLSTSQQQFLLSAYEQASQSNENLQQKLSMGLISAEDILLAIKHGTPLTTALPAPPTGPLSMRNLCINIQAASPLDLVKAQYCNLRQLSMEHGDYLLETALNADMLEPVVAGCQALTTELRPQFTSLTAMAQEAAIDEMTLMVDGAQTSGKKLSRQAQTCLGLAYQHDDSEAAFAALLLLSGLKDAVYIELTGYHIAFGLGPESQDPASAYSWAEAALANLPESDVSLTAQTSAQRGKILSDVMGILSAYR